MRTFLPLSRPRQTFRLVPFYCGPDRTASRLARRVVLLRAATMRAELGVHPRELPGMSVVVRSVGAAFIEAGRLRLSPSAERSFALVLYLAMERHRRLSRDAIETMLFPDQTEKNARHSLRQQVYELRQAGVAVDSNRGGLAIQSDTIRVDVDEMLAAEALDADQLRLIEGGFLPGYAPEFSQAFSEWLEARRGRVSFELRRVVAECMQGARELDDWRRLEASARALVALDPLNDAATLALAEAMSALGSRGDAVRVIDNYVSDVGESLPTVRARASRLRRQIQERPVAYDGSCDSEPAFVGRDEPMRLIGDLLRSAREGRGGALIVTGPAGIGKTRVLAEAATRAAIAGLQLVRVRCQAGDLLRPLAGVVDLVPQVLSLRGAAGADPRHVERLKRVTDVGNAAEDVALPQTSPEVLRAQIVAALMDVLDAASGEVPVFLQVDDLQWADSSLGWLWDRLLAWSATRPVAWLFACRGSATDVPSIQAPPLPLASLDAVPAGALLENVATQLGRSLKPGVRKSLLLHAGGNPLFLRELGRQWAYAGSTKGLPASLALLLDGGVAKLSATALRTLQAAAILGLHATTERIERVVQLSRTQFVDTLLELEQAGILTTGEDGAAYGHVLWADAAVSRLSPSVTRTLHRYVAECLEGELDRSSSPALLWEVARQWEAAGNGDRARTALVRGAEYLARQGFPEEAAAAYDRAERASPAAVDKLPLLARRSELLISSCRWEELSREAGRYMELARVNDPLFDEHNEVELRALFADYMTSGDNGGLARRTLVCATSPSASPAHRDRKSVV